MSDAELLELLAPLNDLLEACERDMGGPSTEEFSDDTPVAMYGDGTNSAMVFGHIRKAREAMDALLEALSGTGVVTDDDRARACELIRELGIGPPGVVGECPPVKSG